MNKNIQKFLESVDVRNTVKVLNFVLKDVEDNIECYSLMELEQFILNSKPSSPKAITTICYVLGLYAKWLGDDAMHQRIQSLDKKLLWKKAKPNTKKKYISHREFEEIYHEIGVYEEYNSFYYQTIFRAIFEGVWNDDMSVLKNLRSSDINDKIVVLHEDSGHSYKLKISEKLASDLKKLASINVWERANRYGAFEVDTRGLHHDSVFKVEGRKTGVEGSYRFSYYSRLRRIVKEYIERPLAPLDLYISGIMHRIIVELDERSITLEEAFAERTYSKAGNSIIARELVRCNYDIDIANFKELVKGHLDSFIG